jgi:hydroxyacylglutathione hydrolase
VALNFDVRWIHGARDCRSSTDPPLQAHRAEERTFIFRQSKCTNFEAPFSYLLVGAERALLLDTGAESDSGDAIPVRARVEEALAECGVATDSPLVIAHSHSHGDHMQGDGQFRNRPQTTVIAPSQSAITTFFGIDPWPEGTGRLDLGGRELTILAIPGHEPAHIAVYDASTQALLSGDTFYPGLLVVNDWPSYRASAGRLAAFARTYPVSWLLGAHVEMGRTPGELYPPPTTFQPDEHPLQLKPFDLFQWAEACEKLGDDATGEHGFGKFVLHIR